MALCSVRCLQKATLGLILLSLLQLLLLNYVLICEPADAANPLVNTNQPLRPTEGKMQSNKRALPADGNNKLVADIAKWLEKEAPVAERMVPEAACRPATRNVRANNKSVSVLAVGSINLAAYGGTVPSPSIDLNVLPRTDITVTTLVHPLREWDNTSLPAVRLFQRSGLHFTSVATEHFYSSGDKGVLATTLALKEAAINWLGVTFKQLDIVVVNGVKIGLVAFCAVRGKCVDSDHIPLAPIKYTSRSAADAVNELRMRGASVVVALVRWGLDGSHYPDEPALGVARHLANLGATLVVGSHPLLQQDHAYFGNTLILFSAGPFYRPTTHSDLCWPQGAGGERQFSESDHCRRIHPNIRVTLLESEQQSKLYHIHLTRSGKAVADYVMLPLKQIAGYDTLSMYTADMHWTRVCGERDTHCLACQAL